MQKLKIIPRDQSYIDLTISPPASPRVKREHGIDDVEVEDAKDVKPENKHEVDSAVESQQATATPALRSEPINPARSLGSERNKKRKALQEEFNAIELQQKKMRIAKALADLDDEN